MRPTRQPASQPPLPLTARGSPSQRDLAHCADDFWMTGVTDQNELATRCGMVLDFAMYLRNEGAGRVDLREPPLPRLRPDGLGNSMRREHDRRAVRDLIEFFDKNGTLRSETATTQGLCTIWCRTKTGAPNRFRLSSTVWIARSTPAQNPRGLANRIKIGRRGAR